ncbi:unnamed protein product [Lota lota]
MTPMPTMECCYCQHQEEWDRETPVVVAIKTSSDCGNTREQTQVVYHRWQAPGQGTDLLQLLVPRVLRLLFYAKKGPSQRWHAPLQRYLVGSPMERSAATMVERLVEEMVNGLGVLAELHSDQERNMESQVFREELRTPVDLVFGVLPEPEIAGAKNWTTIVDWTATSGVRQKRAYDNLC